MSEPLGLSVGTTNLVAAGVGRQPVIRRSVLTVFGHAAPVVGTPEQTDRESRGEAGVALTGFVDRVGDPVPLVAADGESYPAEQLLVEALESMAELALASEASVGASPSEVVIAVPSYWTQAMSGALRATLGASEILAPGGATPRLIPDAVAALTALNASPGIDRRGTVVLLDFGGGGTSITVADTRADTRADKVSAFDMIDGTRRIPELAGDQIDQALLSHVLRGIGGDGDDPARTAAVGSLSALREQCRWAKERLSAETVTELPVELPGHRMDIRVTRTELEELIERPLEAVIDALEDMLGRNNIGWDAVSAVALVGGGASIPLIVQRLSERSRAPVVTSLQPALDAGAGAALMAAYGRGAETATWVAPAAAAPGTGREEAGSTNALAWSQDVADDDVVPYTGEDPYAVAAAQAPTAPPPTPGRYGSPAPLRFDNGDKGDKGDRGDNYAKASQRLPMSVFGIAASVALVAVGGVAIALTSVDSADRDPPKPSTAPLSGAFTPSPAPAETVTLNNQPVPQPAAPTSEAAPPPVVATTTPPTTAAPSTTPPTTTTTTTTTPTTTTTTTTTPPTTTPPTTTAPVTTTQMATPTTTAAPVTTTAAPVTTTARAEATQPPLTTTYVTAPFVPVPIPIVVPQGP